MPALTDPGEAALNLVLARIDIDGVTPSELSESDHAAYACAQHASTEFHHANNQLGEWFRESGRRRALEQHGA